MIKIVFMGKILILIEDSVIEKWHMIDFNASQGGKK